MAVEAIIRAPRDTAANWTSVNPVLKLGEIGLDTTNNLLKAGDGAAQWTSLGYITVRFADILSKPTTLAGYGIVDAQPLDSDLSAIAALATTATGRDLLTSANAAAIRSKAGTVIGSDVQAYSANLTAIAAVTPAADRIIYWTSGSAAAVTPLTSFGRSLIDDADAAAARATLDLVIGTSGNTIAKLDGAAATWTNGANFGGAVSIAGVVTSTGTNAGFNMAARDSTQNFIWFAEGDTLKLFGSTPTWSFSKAGLQTIGKLAIRDDSPFNTGANISSGSNNLLFGTTGAGFVFVYQNSTLRLTIDTSGNTRPGADLTYGLGTASVRWLAGYIAALYSGIRTITATASVATSDFTILCNANSAAITVNLPAASGMAGRVLVIKKIDASANAVTIDGSGAETIDGVATKAITTQWSAFMIQCDGTSWFIL